MLATAISLVASASNSTLDRENFILSDKIRVLQWMCDVVVGRSCDFILIEFALSRDRNSLVRG